MTARDKAIELIGERLVRELENARMIVVEEIDYETKLSWIAYLEAQLKVRRYEDGTESGNSA